MATIEVNVIDVKEQIKELQNFRNGWANDIREGWKGGLPGAKELIFYLYQISGCLILALQDVVNGRFRDKMAMLLVKRKLFSLTQSRSYQRFDEMGKAGICNVITTGTKHHILIMEDCLKLLTA